MLTVSKTWLIARIDITILFWLNYAFYAVTRDFTASVFKLKAAAILMRTKLNHTSVSLIVKLSEEVNGKLQYNVTIN